MTDTIDTVIADIMANRANVANDDRQHEADVAREDTLRHAETAAALRSWKDLKARIEKFVTELNAKLTGAHIAITLIDVECKQDVHLIAEQKAQFTLASQAVNYNMRTVFKAHTNGQLDIFVAAVDGTAPRKTFEFRTETMNDDDIADVFAKYLEIGTRNAA